MKDLYLILTILCFLAAITVYCVKKGIQALKELHNAWKKFDKAQKDLEENIKEFYRKK